MFVVLGIAVFTKRVAANQASHVGSVCSITPWSPATKPVRVSPGSSHIGSSKEGVELPDGARWGIATFSFQF